MAVPTVNRYTPAATYPSVAQTTGGSWYLAPAPVARSSTLPATVTYQPLSSTQAGPVPAASTAPSLLPHTVPSRAVMPQTLAPQSAVPQTTVPHTVLPQTVLPQTAYASPYQLTRPVIPGTSVPGSVYYGKGLIGQPKLYVEGQPLRNVLRYLTP